MDRFSDAFAIAVQRHQAGDLEAAERAYQQALAFEPNHADALHLLGVVGMQLGKHEFARACISRAIEINGSHFAYHFNLGLALTNLGQLADAEKAYRRVLELEPNYVDACSNLGDVYRRRGMLDDAAVHFRRAVELKPDNAEALNDLGVALQDQSKTDEAVACFRHALELKPDLATAHYNLGNAFKARGQLDDAVSCYKRAVELPPTNADALSNLGVVLASQGKLDLAVESYRKALDLKPNDAEVYANLGDALRMQDRLNEALECCRRALEISPHSASAHGNLGNALLSLQKYDDSLACFNRAVELERDFADAHYSRASLNLLLGNFRDGWPEYEWRWKRNVLEKREFARPKWDGSGLGKRTLLLHAEQGFGDVIQFVRYAAVVKNQNPAAKVILECYRSMTPLLSRCQGVDRFIAQGDELPELDVYLPLLSLPDVLQTTVETIPANVPYIFPDANLVEFWRARLLEVGGFRIGVNWQGRTGPGEFRKRSIPLQHFDALIQLSGISFISLQKGEACEELNQRPTIIDLGNAFDLTSGAFVDTAAIMMNLDLVITSDTSIAHLAGALGIPVWVALPFVPDWRWLLDRTDSSWYPTMRLFRQKALGDWGSVFEDIQIALLHTVQEMNA
jgi:tetratricopeptide (TPR) repeat protein